MKTLPSIILILAAISVVLSCKKDDIDVYKMEDSAVSFVSTTNSFSLRGLTEALDTLRVPLELVGPVADYDRPISVLIKDHERNTAKENADFRIIEAVVKAGAMSGYILVEVKKLQVNVDELVTTLQIQPNEYFRKGYSGFDATIVSWSETYARPAQEKVWRAWYNFFCHGYSRNLHSVMITVFGEEIETYSQQKPTEEEAAQGVVLQTITFWYAASRTLREYVANYDKEHPDAPLMHSDDYEAYSNYTVAVGNGTKPDEIPTIYETLLVY